MRLPTVIWSEFEMGQDRDDDHQEDAPHFIKSDNDSILKGKQAMTIVLCNFPAYSSNILNIISQLPLSIFCVRLDFFLL